MLLFGLGVGTVGVGDQPQMAQYPPQPRRVQAAGRFHQHRFSVGGGVGGQVVGAVGQDLGVGRRDGSLSQGLGGAGQGTPVQRPGGAHQAGSGPGPHAQPGPQPGSGGGGRDAVLSAGGAAGVQVGELS